MREITIIKNLLPLLRLHRWWFLAMVILGSLQSLAEGVGIGLFIPLLDLLVADTPLRSRGHWLADTLSGMFRGVPPEHRLTIIILCLFAAVSTTALLAYLHGVLVAWIEGSVGDYLRRSIFRQLLTVNFDFIERDRSGRLVNVLATETWYTTEALKMFGHLTSVTSTLIVYVALLLLMSWRLTVVVGGALLLISTVVRFVTKRVREFGEKANESNSELTHLMVQGIDGMRVIRAFGRESYEQGRFGLYTDRVRHAFFRMHALDAAVHPLHDLLAATVLLMIVFATARSGGDISALLVFVFVLYRLQPRVKDFDMSLVRLVGLSPSVEEVRSLIDTSDKRYVRSGTALQPGLEHGIEFNRVSFRYDNADDPALTDVSFTIPARRTTALVGLSGGGKSTIIKLILRFEDPTEGSIRLDGRPIQEFDLGSWRSQLALVSQDVYLFNATVRENIAYGRLDAGLEEIVDAARKADAHDFIERLPAKYETVLGARGLRLSGGQQQRISLARAIIRNPRILILDEATNSLDSISEQWIQETLDKLHSHRTVVMIAHRLSTIERADQIIVLDQGRVVEQGTLSELVKADGLFARLYELQYSRTSVHDV